MFDIGGIELLVIAVVAILVVRPKDLPTMLRTVGQYVGRLRSMAREFQHQFEEAARDTGVDEIRKGISSVQDLSPANKVKEAFNSIGDEVESVKDDVETPLPEAAPEDTSAEQPAKPAKPAAKPAKPAAKPAAKRKPATSKPASPAKKSSTAKKAKTPSKAATDG